MENTCQNCGTAITVNFCGNCGQKKFKRIDRKYLIDELQYSLIHTNKGFFYSIKKILRNPGKTAKEFIEGNRINHYKPILLAFVLSGISAFISWKIIGMSEIMELFYAEKKMNTEAMHQVFSFINSYNSFIMLLLIPIVSVLTYIVFRGWGNNYYEHIIMNAYIQCFYTVSCILFLYPILFIIKYNAGNLGSAFMTATSISIVSIPLIMIWFYKGFYSEKGLGSIILRVILFLILGFILYLLSIILFVLFYIMNTGLEGLKDFAPKK